MVQAPGNCRGCPEGNGLPPWGLQRLHKEWLTAGARVQGGCWEKGGISCDEWKEAMVARLSDLDIGGRGREGRDSPSLQEVQRPWWKVLGVRGCTEGPWESEYSMCLGVPGAEAVV